MIIRGLKLKISITMDNNGNFGTHKACSGLYSTYIVLGHNGEACFTFVLISIDSYYCSLFLFTI